MVTQNALNKALKNPFDKISLKDYKKSEGKVRDIYSYQDKRILITTDRISAFDRVLGNIPFKGQVLNQLSEFWFEKTKKTIANHFLDAPHPNVTVAKTARPYPIEMVVRGYITGVTSTAIWKLYNDGDRVIYGIKFPEGLKKNQKLKEPIVTPTTKAEHGGHDERLTEKEILEKKLVPEKVWKQMKKAALELYKKGNEVVGKRGLILVDTKYEFGEVNGKVTLIDEIHTPDSSRFWKKSSYEKQFKKGQEPENFDKEFFRIWYVKKGYRGDGKPPEMSQDLKVQTAKRYIKIYELITGKKFKPQAYPLETGIQNTIKNILGGKKNSKEKNKIVMLLGSKSDLDWAKEIGKYITPFGVPFQIRIASAHKSPEYALSILREYEKGKEKIVFIAIAGRSNALGGFMDGNTIFPVINCPPKSDSYGGMDILSSLRMPGGIGAATVLDPDNAAILAIKILSIGDPSLGIKIADYHKNLVGKIKRDDQSLNP